MFYWGSTFVCLVRWCGYSYDTDVQSRMEMLSQWGLSLQPASSHLCSGLQVGRLLQQLAMTGSEEGDPRTKSSLGKFDKVRADPMSCEGLCMESSAKI